MSLLPTLFISHGAPDLLLHASPARDFLQQLGGQLEKPQAILVISAHWTAQHLSVSAAPQPKTIHDFSGFPAPLYELTYPAPGAPELAIALQERLAQFGLPCQVVTDRGLDHGAWVPLMAIYPAADIPVIQLSIQPHLDPQYHWRLGAALRTLRSAGVLILASGAITHNLQHFRGQDLDAEPPTWVKQFDDWMAESLTAMAIDRLLQYRQVAPYAVENHPTEEHLLPLFVALGAAGDRPQSQQLHTSFTYGILSMAAYAFENQD
ncbi:MAG: dioxygenase [Elainella sp. Prado103]|jgi:4,5-DOPA dioxygenase extradiol|nr:dioxygenase [Elainella sp. Prado103]